MKKKLFFGFIGMICFAFLVGSGIGNENSQSTKDKNLLALQEASAQMANMCCPIWDVTVVIKWSGPETSCTTGGRYKCNDCTCPTGGGSNTNPPADLKEAENPSSGGN